MSLTVLLARRFAFHSKDGHRIYRALNPTKMNTSIVHKQGLYSSGNCSKGVCRSRASNSDNQAQVGNPSTKTDAVVSQQRPHERDPTKWLYKQLLTKSNEILTTSRCKIDEFCRQQQDLIPSSEEYKAWKRKADSIVCKYQHSCFVVMTAVLGKVTVASDALTNQVAQYSRIIRSRICRTRGVLLTIRGHPMCQRCMQPIHKFLLESEVAKTEREKYKNEIRKMIKK